MKIFDGECFESLLDCPFFDVEDPGPLFHPINKFKIFRDEDLQLILETETPIDSKSDRVDYLPGTVRTNDSRVQISVMDHIKVLLKGVQPNSSTEHFSAVSIEGNRRVEKAGVWELEIVIGNSSEGAYLVEWLDNFDDGYFLLPDLVSDKVQTTLNQSFKADDKIFKVLKTRETQSSARNCIKSSVDDIEYFLVITKKNPTTKRANGYILYTSIPTKETRKRLRDSISFVIGRPLIYIGHTLYDDEWNVVSTVAKSAHTLGGRAFEIHSMPPSPLSLEIANGLDPFIFTNSVNAIYRSYELLSLEFLFWNYWDAVVAPISMAPAHWGALHESLIRVASEKLGSKIKRTIVEGADWEESKKHLLNIIKQIKADEAHIKILESKIHNLNLLPQSEVNKRFLKNIGLEFSRFEMGVWKRRNDAAHGVMTKPDQHIVLIREVKVLKVLLHRIILRLTGANSYYYDYYSLDYPILCIPLILSSHSSVLSSRSSSNEQPI